MVRWRATRIALSTLRENYPDALGAYKPLVFLVKCMAPFYSTSMTDLCARRYCGTICAAIENALELTDRAPDCMKFQAMHNARAHGPKLLWVARHEPEHFQRWRASCCEGLSTSAPLTGIKLTDPSDASGTLWLDVRTSPVVDELLQACDMSLSPVPPIEEGSRAAGGMCSQCCWRARSTRKCNCCGRRGRHRTERAAWRGRGAMRGMSFLSLVRSGVLSVVTEQFRPSPPHLGVHALCHAIPNHQYTDRVCVLSAASCIRWLMQPNLSR